jgi:hypothetical protein
MTTVEKYLLGISTIIIIVLATFFIIIPAQAFNVNHLEYTIFTNGDAFVTADYNLTFVESLALPLVKGEITTAIQNEYGPDAEVAMITDTRTEVDIPKFADEYNTYVQTPTLNFENTQSRIQNNWFLKTLNIDYSPDTTTIVSFNGTKYDYQNQMIIPALTLEK